MKEIDELLFVEIGLRDHKVDLDLQEGAQDKIVKNVGVLCCLLQPDIRVYRIEPFQNHGLVIVVFFQALRTDALFPAADPVAVDYLGEDPDSIHPGQGKEVIFLVCVEAVLCQPDVVLLQDPGPVGDGMHGKPVMAAQIIEADHFLTDILRFVPDLLVPVLLKDPLESGNDHILLSICKLVYKSCKPFSVKPVIPVQQAEIFSPRGPDRGIYSGSVASVFLVDHAEGLRIFFLIFLRDLQSVVCGTVVYDDHFQPVHDLRDTAGVQGSFDVVFDIVGGDRYAQYFFHRIDSPRWLSAVSEKGITGSLFHGCIDLIILRYASARPQEGCHPSVRSFEVSRFMWRVGA